MSWKVLGETAVERCVPVNACSAMVKRTFFDSLVQFDMSRGSASLRETEKHHESRRPIKTLSLILSLT